jgi:ATP/maltotriose-dependent transcriptional regulator MalT
LLAAPAGLGKSALLVRWRSELVRRVTVIFVPISIRFRTNLPSVFYAALTAQLARFHGEKVPTFGNISAEEWREQAADYLTLPIPKGQQLVVILDGLDEAAGDSWPGPGFFPHHPPDGLRLVVSARCLAGDANSSAWISRLGWDDHWQAQSIDLGVTKMSWKCRTNC